MKDELQKLVDKRYSTRDIAEELNTSQTNVRYHLKKHGLKTNPDLSKKGTFGEARKIERTSEQKRELQADRKNKQKRHYKEFSVKYKGGKCIKCGYDKCLDALEFHHRIPEEKSFALSSSANHSKKEVLKELDKCDMLCANCHREHHHNERNNAL